MAIHSIAHLIKPKSAAGPLRFSATKLGEGDEPLVKSELTANELDIDHVTKDLEML
ncbi:MAG: hypothetical protein ACLR2G_08285 [Phascolarctobacterium faecium]